MRYTLFVDESGRFPTHPQECVVAGVLCASELKLAREILEETSAAAGEEFDLALSEMHLSNLRKNGWAEESILELSESLFDSLLDAEVPIYFLAVTNDAKIDVTDPDDLDRNYRMMLLDLVSLAESVIPDEQRVDFFHAFVATRTWDDQLMTTKDEIDNALENSMQSSMEAGLVARGLVELVNNEHFKLELKQFHKNHCLIAADFLANTVRNRNRAEQVGLVSRLQSKGSLFLFEAMRGTEARKSRIAERDGDYASALCWCLLDRTFPLGGEDQDFYLINLLRKVMNQSGAESIRFTLESVIERLWQQAVRSGAYAPLYAQLGRLEAALLELADYHDHSRLVPARFRLRNFMLAIANHLGDMVDANRLIDSQASDRQFLVFKPEYLSLILDSYLYCIETAINDLQFDEALNAAICHYELVAGYRAMWAAMSQDQLPLNDPALGFEQSRIYHKAETSLLRCRVLTMDPLEGTGLTDLQDSLERLGRLPLHPADAGRVHNYRIMLCLRAGNYVEAMALGWESLERNPSAFDIFWAARSTVDALLMGEYGSETSAKKMLDFLRQKEETFPSNNHPYDLIWRERGILEQMVHHDSDAAARCYDRSGKAETLISPISTWLTGLLELHRSNLDQDGSMQFESFFEDKPTGCQRLARLATDLAAGQNPLPFARYVSPY